MKEGIYMLNEEKTSVDELYERGKELLKERQMGAAYTYFEKCLTIDPNYQKAHFQLFIKSVKQRNYQQAFFYFDTLYKTDNIYYKKDCNFYLYLLNMITQIPLKYQRKVKEFTISDFLVVENINYSSQSNIRFSAWKQKFLLASKQLKQFTETQDHIKSRDTISRILINQAIELQLIIKAQISDLLRVKDYIGVKKILEKEELRHPLTVGDSHLLELIDDLLMIKHTHTVPKKEIIDTDNLFEAIEGKNYEKALLLAEKYAKVHQYENKSAIRIVLEDIKATINKRNQNDVEVKQISDEVKNIIASLKDTKDALVFHRLNEYLVSIKRSEYQALIYNLIGLALEKKDYQFKEVTMVLNSLRDNTYVFDPSEYTEDFYAAYYQGNSKLVNYYFNIIASSPVKQDNLDQFLINAKKLIAKKEQEESYAKDLAFVNKNLATVYDKGLVLLKPKDNEERQNFFTIVKGIEDIVAFDLNNEEQQIALRFKPPRKKNMRAGEIAEAGRQAYRDGCYESCIENYKELLQLERPRTYVYAKLGLSFYHLKDYKTAIDYMTVSTALNKEEEKKGIYDFSSLIASLKEKNMDKESLPSNKIYIKQKS